MRSRGLLHGVCHLLSFCIVVEQCLAQQQCYYPAGNMSPDIPCNDTGSHSACCGAGAFCLGNGLCYVDALISRGSCTDKTFKDPSCPSYCTEWQPDIGAALVNCNGATDAFICAGQSCSDDAALFTMRDANTFVFNTTGNSVVELSAGEVLNLATTTASTSTGVASQTASGTTAAITSTTSSAGSGGKYTAGDMAGVGVGIGVPLLLALLGALYVIQKQRKRLAAFSSNSDVITQQPPNPQSPAPGYSKSAAAGYGSPQTYPHDPLLPVQPAGPNRSLGQVTLPRYHSEMDNGSGINELGIHHEMQELDTTK